MSKLQHGSSEELESIRHQAIAHFGPIMLHEALLRLCRACGADSLDRFEKAMIEKIERSFSDLADFDDMKEFATEQLYSCVREVKASPDMTHPLEDIHGGRTVAQKNQRRLKTNSRRVSRTVSQQAIHQP